MAGVGRRSVAAGLAGLGAGSCARLGPKGMAGSLGGASFERGHRLGAMRFPAPSEERRVKLLVCGGGISGLSAGWTLAEAGVEDFKLLELEDSCGGNARSGRNAISAFPLGAHYLPIPNREAVGVRRLLERLGVITGWQDGRPVFDPYSVVSDPDERLFWQGRWQAGLVPAAGVAPADRKDLDAFFAAMAGFRHRKGGDGRPAFALPMAMSSRDEDLRALDEISFAEWLDRQGWRSPVLRGHVRYCVRDDYGTEPDQVSAWAGIHYFASRRGEAANVEGEAVLTWPEGNGRLARLMGERLAGRLVCGQIVHAVREAEGGVAADVFDVNTRKTVRWRAQAAILATPRFVTARIAKGQSAEGFTYAPWVVANVSVDRLPAGRGVEAAWDNVSWSSNSLGYVVATHQGLERVPGASVLTWYMPLSDMAPEAARTLMLTRKLKDWQDLVEADLLATNPDLKGAIRSIDVWRWGHAMIRPLPGFIWGGAREAAAKARPPIFFAHSDLSGLSVFEEAHYHGVTAAEAAMAHTGLSFTSQMREEAA